MTQPTISVALAADRNILPGLHVTMHSALEHTPREYRLDISLVSEGLRAAELGCLRATLDACGNPYCLRVIPAAQLPFSDTMPKLHGSRMSCARLYMADLMPGPRFIYLDADVLVQAPLLDLWTCDMGGCVIAGCHAGTADRSNDWPLLRRLGHPPKAPYLNAGVLLVDAARWRAEGLTQSCEAFAAEHKGRLNTCDQCVLNGLLWNRCHWLAANWNRYVYAGGAPYGIGTTPGIYHFVGSPKPWDPWGRILHRSASAFHAELARTSYTGGGGTRLMTAAFWLRFARLGGSYKRLLHSRIRTWRNSHG